MNTLIRCPEGLSLARLRTLLVDDILKDPAFFPLSARLAEALMAAGVHFHSPGGSFNRVVCELMSQYYGIDFCGWHPSIPENEDVRSGLDGLARAIEERLVGAD